MKRVGTLVASHSFLIVLLVPLLFLGSMLVVPGITLLSGTSVTLKTIPLDPRDLFYGDHVNLQFEASQVSINKADKDVLTTLKNRSSDTVSVFVEIVPDGDLYVVKQVTLHEPESGIYIKGEAYTSMEPNTIQVNYSFDVFYVEENKGLELEELSRNGELIAELKVWRGHTILQKVAPIR
ncbi:GDYXXLXY domain-containing protein [Brevibacillus daliensis]|uniref:GDYXXLXY domain-containing protein n=1 Tax=Brevibacillus daliensis TaxID=2892995 RepID=UPI001E61DFDA|nr:GDYXXLXY domain-containing protein [Brevibacillus daliensis]